MPKYRLTPQEQNLLLDSIAVAADVAEMVDGSPAYAQLASLAGSVRIERITVRYSYEDSPLAEDVVFVGL